MARELLYGSIERFDPWHDGLRIRFTPHGDRVERITIQAEIESVLETDSDGWPTLVRFRVVSLTAHQGTGESHHPGETASSDNRNSRRYEKGEAE